jgi:hypothetical protein
MANFIIAAKKKDVLVFRVSFVNGNLVCFSSPPI